MKKIIILNILIFSSLLIIAQNFFDIEIGAHEYIESPTCVIQNNSNEYIITGVSQNSEPKSFSYIIKLSETGEILQEKRTTKKDSDLVSCGVIQLENNNYLIFSALYPENNYKKNNYIVLTEIDDDFNIIKEYKLKFPIDSMYLHSAEVSMKQANENEVICYGYCVLEEERLLKSFIYKISTNGDSLLYKTLPEKGIGDLEIYNSEKIYYTGPNITKNLTVLNYSDFTLDTILVISDVMEYGFSRHKVAIEFLTDSSFVLYGISYDNNYNNYQAFVTLDTSFNNLNTFTKIIEIQSDWQTLQMETMDVSLNKEIVAAYTTPFSNIYITKTDEESNFLWEISYPTTNMVLWFEVFATNDGGCMSLGYDYTTQDIRVIKTDSNGNLTHINGVAQNRIEVFPNPASDILKVQKAVQVSGAEIVLYNSVGQTVLRKKLTESITEINISNFPSGVYIYNILKDGKKDDEGKIIVE